MAKPLQDAASESPRRCPVRSVRVPLTPHRREGGGHGRSRFLLLPFVMSPFARAMAAFLSNPAGDGRGKEGGGTGRRPRRGRWGAVAGDPRGGIGAPRRAPLPRRALPRTGGWKGERRRAAGSGMGNVTECTPGSPESRRRARFHCCSSQLKRLPPVERVKGGVQLSAFLKLARSQTELVNVRRRWELGRGRGRAVRPRVMTFSELL